MSTGSTDKAIMSIEQRRKMKMQRLPKRKLINVPILDREPNLLLCHSPKRIHIVNASEPRSSLARTC